MTNGPSLKLLYDMPLHGSNLPPGLKTRRAQDWVNAILEQAAKRMFVCNSSRKDSD
ncbi:MAG: hypothetical protein KAW61_05590 [candidate division Zixibacteria bacterium]|nr:hypothetical protein [candidate division Zixibacteria bacterium]